MFGEPGTWQRQVRCDGEAQGALPTRGPSLLPGLGPSGLGSACVALGWSGRRPALQAGSEGPGAQPAAQMGRRVQTFKLLLKARDSQYKSPARISEHRTRLSSHLFGTTMRMTHRISDMKRPQRTQFFSPAPSPWVCPISGHVVTSHPEARTTIRSGTADSSPRHRLVIRRSCPRPLRGMHLNACIPASPSPGRADGLQRGSPRLNLSFRPRACAWPRPRPGPASPCPQVSCHRALCLVPLPRQERSH